jgi:hypothetical protein
LSQKAFCEKHSLKKSTFKNWVYRYRENVLDQTPDAHEAMTPHKLSVTEPSALFVAVHLTPDECQDIPPLPEQASSRSVKSRLSPSPLRLETGSFCITIPVGFDGDTLRSVLSIVQACA